MKKVMLMSLVVLMLSATAARADINITAYIGQLLKNDGLTPFDIGSTLVILADANNNGFGDLTQAAMWTTDVGDKVIGHFDTNDFLGFPGSSQNVFTYSTVGIDIGDPLMLAFYNTPYINGATGAGGGVHFGTYRTNDVGGGDIGWLNPADGATVNLTFLTEAVGGTVPNGAGIATLQTIGGSPIPEPVSTVLALIGGGAMVLRRKFVGNA